MWIAISNEHSLVNKPCERCGSKRYISKTWTEEYETLTGKKSIECSQVDCTNQSCQELFDKKNLEEAKKREMIRKVKDKRDALRKVNALKKRKNKSRTNVL